MRRALTFIEYGLLIAVIVAGLLVMRVYFQRAVQGKWKENADRFGYGVQYDQR